MNIKSITDVIASEKSWIEGLSIQQLESVARLNGMIKAVGLPDMHPGKGTPIGCASITRDIIYPHLIGNDIGCGMSFFKINHSIKKVKLNKWANKLEQIKDFDNYDQFDFITDHGDTQGMGSIGGGNHFAEFQVLDTLYAHDSANECNIDKDSLYLLVHSGSRGLGNLILDRYIRKYSAQNGLPAESPEGKMYMQDHDRACSWASANRGMIACKMASIIGAKARSMEMVLDKTHNSLSRKMIDDEKYFIHRKGASPGDEGVVIIPGSRGSLSYLVKPANDTGLSAYSMPHGAGRKWDRGQCKGRLKSKYTRESLKKTKYGSWVVCKNQSLLYEEAPEAYKNIDQVIYDMEEAGLIQKIAAFKPLITYKP
jgi:release factor H-coupled RctB family protein